jgi:hypothetical protein
MRRFFARLASVAWLGNGEGELCDATPLSEARGVSGQIDTSRDASEGSIKVALRPTAAIHLTRQRR